MTEPTDTEEIWMSLLRWRSNEQLQAIFEKLQRTRKSHYPIGLNGRIWCIKRAEVRDFVKSLLQKGG